jgi:ubiquitin C-terminal hydrolase
MAAQPVSSSSPPLTQDVLIEKLSSTNDKIAEYIESSKTLVLLGLFFAVAFHPTTLEVIGATFLTPYSFVIIPVISVTIGLFLIFCTFSILEQERNRRELKDSLRTLFPRDKEQPLGISNAGCNCWANSMIQFILNIASLQERINRLGFFNPLHVLKSIKLRYLTEREDQGNYFSSIDSQTFRKALHSKNETISSSSDHQEDPHEAFNISQLLPKISMEKRVQYSHHGIDGPLEYEERDRSLHLLGNETFETVGTDIVDCISLPIRQGFLLNYSLTDLLDIYLNNTNLEKDGSTQFLDCRGEALRRYPSKRESYRFKAIPNDLFFSLKRFDNEGCKVNVPVNIPLQIHLKRGKHLLEGDANLELDGFIIHLGDSLKSGHYKSCIKKNGQWYLCNDKMVSKVTEKEALDLAKTSYLYHYQKIA